MVSILQHPSILCGGKSVGVYEEKSMFSFFLSHTNFLIIFLFLTRVEEKIKFKGPKICLLISKGQNFPFFLGW